MSNLFFLLAAGHCLLCMCLAASRMRSTRLAGLKIALCFPCLLVCLFVCISALITCAIITSHTLLPCDFTLVDLMAALSTGITTMSNQAQLQV